MPPGKKPPEKSPRENCPRKINPRKYAPGKLTPGKLSPGNIPPGKLPPGQLPLEKLFFQIFVAFDIILPLFLLKLFRITNVTKSSCLDVAGVVDLPQSLLGEVFQRYVSVRHIAQLVAGYFSRGHFSQNHIKLCHARTIIQQGFCKTSENGFFILMSNCNRKSN